MTPIDALSALVVTVFTLMAVIMISLVVTMLYLLVDAIKKNKQ